MALGVHRRDAGRDGDLRRRRRGSSAARASPSTSTCSRGWRVFGREGDDIVLRAPLSALPRLRPLPGHDDGRGGDDRQPHVRRHGRGELLPEHRAGVPRRCRRARRERRLAGADRGVPGADRLRSLVVLALYGVGCIGASMLDPLDDAGSVANAFAHSLVPIAFAYVSAHYFTFLVFQGQTIIPLASDPLGSRLRLLRDGGRDDRLRPDRRRQRLVHPGASWSSSATRWRSPWPTTARSSSTPRSATRCARSSGCSA